MTPFLTLNHNLMMQASGNVTIETVHKIGQSGVTFISRLQPQQLFQNLHTGFVFLFFRQMKAERNVINAVER